MKAIFFSLLMLMSVYSISAQSLKEADRLIPWDYVSQSIRKANKTVMGIESSVNLSIVAALTENNACRKGANDGRLDLNIHWFNAADETGAFMLQMMKDMNGVGQEKDNFQMKASSGAGEVKTEEWSGGTLWYEENERACMNEISGPTGITELSTHARFFLFNGASIIKIEVGGMNNIATTKAIIARTLGLIREFDFSVLKNLSGSE
ncbi:MAG: hypothetical protein FD166_2256 [Bacteroidetes bacterium]|nr:MAG: hypothetical protein FD166_2256 [Bacteroidota bacterium]